MSFPRNAGLGWTVFALIACGQNTDNSEQGTENGSSVSNTAAPTRPVEVDLRVIPEDEGGGADPAEAEARKAPGVVQAEMVATDGSALRSALQQKAPVTISLFGHRLILRPDTSAVSAPEIWQGKVEGDEGSLARFIVRPDRIYGTIRTGDRGFELVSRGDSVLLASEIDLAKLPDEAEADEQPGAFDNLSGQEPSATPPAEISLLLLYTPSLLNHLKKKGINIDDYVLARQALLDDVYANGKNGFGTRVRIVHHAQYTGKVTTATSTQLDLLDSDSPTLKLRDSVKADLVSLMTLSLNHCGVGLFYYKGQPTRAYSVTQSSCEYKYTVAHEIGHNLGAAHAREDTSKDSPSQCNYGFKSLKAKARTVMAYKCSGGSCPRQPYFSDTRIHHNGISMGRQCAASNGAENYLTVIKTLPSVAAYR